MKDFLFVPFKFFFYKATMTGVKSDIPNKGYKTLNKCDLVSHHQAT